MFALEALRYVMRQGMMELSLHGTPALNMKINAKPAVTIQALNAEAVRNGK
jgi:hypothetical protein